MTASPVSPARCDEVTAAGLDLLRALIRIPSYSMEEDGTATAIFGFLADHGLAPRRVGNNVHVRIGNPDPSAPVLLVASHHDTVRVSSDWTRDPFGAEIDGGVLYGLGANDAGAAQCAMAAAVVALKDAQLPYALVFGAAAEEERMGPGGMDMLLSDIGEIDAAIVGEPTGMRMATAERGLIVLECTAHGRAGHAARNTGVNAITVAMRDIAWLHGYRFPIESETLGVVLMTVTQIQAGSQHNVVPDRCAFVVDVRVPDTYTLEGVLDVIRAHVASEVVPRSMRLRSSSIDAAHPLVAAARALGIETFGSATLSDQARIAVPSVKIGPGESERSHTADEHVTLDEFAHGVRTYLDLALALDLREGSATR